ncbi:SDR family oxidoreductase [Streptosporangium sp. NPDC000396]|uniref:SDR family oxidoreductase n=1 Tax=Streptosporangium sp. NPDC000396 TaxID=3366185 RepID=UPI0036B0E50A
MKINDSVVLVTGANRGIGARLVDELLRRGAAKVYAAARRPESLGVHDDRVVPVELDITDDVQIAAAAKLAGDVDLLVNNAGVLGFGGILDIGLDVLERDLAVNYLGTLKTTRAFVPVIEGNGGGAIVNVLTIIALAPMRAMAGYCASKAAADSMTRALRAEVTGRGIAVHGVYPAGVDTEMLAGVVGPKADPAEVARLILDGVEAGAEDITPDPVSQAAWATWAAEPKALERQLAEV